ncbi:MAG: hypothetical protein AAB706_00770 [Patescibacteria group bacterium]
MNTHSILGLLSGILATVAFIPYIYSIVRNETKPHPITWSIWAFIGIVSFGTYFATGATTTLPLALANIIVPLTIAFLSFKYWNWKARFTVFEYACLTISVISIVIWIVSQNPSLALTFNLIADFIAALPTLKKVYLDPSSENATTWIIIVIADILSLFAITEWSYGIVLLPLYFLLISTTIMLLSLRKRI